MATLEHDITIDIALNREEYCDVPETITWLTILIHRIYREVQFIDSEQGCIVHTSFFPQKYHTSVPEYNRLMRKWTSWATLNDIPLAEVDVLPNALW